MFWHIYIRRCSTLYKIDCAFLRDMGSWPNSNTCCQSLLSWKKYVERVKLVILSWHWWFSAFQKRTWTKPFMFSEITDIRILPRKILSIPNTAGCYKSFIAIERPIRLNNVLDKTHNTWHRDRASFLFVKPIALWFNKVWQTWSFLRSVLDKIKKRVMSFCRT